MIIIFIKYNNNNSIGRRIGAYRWRRNRNTTFLESNQRESQLNVTMNKYVRSGRSWTIYLVHIRALISLYQINTDKCTHILLNHNFINPVCHSNMVQSLKGHLQRTQLIHSSRVCQQNVSPDVKFCALIWISHLVTHFVDLAAEMYQLYSLNMALWGLKHVGVIYRVKNWRFNNTDMSRLTTGIHSEKCVVRRFRRCANVYLHNPR